jgi:mRNA interferase RelE/StbE
MTIRIDKSFQKDISKINHTKIKIAIAETIENIQKAQTFSEIKNLKKLTGYKNFYRIKLGDYRIGLEYTKEHELILVRFLNRKEIYRQFP